LSVEVGDESSDYREWEVKEVECGPGGRFLKLVQVEVEEAGVFLTQYTYRGGGARGGPCGLWRWRIRDSLGNTEYQRGIRGTPRREYP
jgi:hypothetical protein